MKRVIGIALLVGFTALLPSGVDAQLRGLGRIAGKVTDGGGAPLPGVAIKATIAGATGSIESTSDDTGAWAVGGMAKGEWDVTFEKPGYAPRKAKVILPAEMARVPPIVVAMQKG
jgi:hypothetical protein